MVQSSLASQATRGLLTLMGALTLALPPVLKAAPAAAAPTTLSYSQLLSDVNQGQVRAVVIDPEEDMAKVWLTSQPANSAPLRIPLFDKNTELIQALNNHQVELSIQPENDRGAYVGSLIQIFFILLLLGGLVLILRRSSGNAGQAMGFGKSRARFQMEAKTGIRFEDVAGIEDAKEELQEVVTFLKKPERFTALGAKIPKGVLLIGPPGTGKTLLAKAIAGEAGAPFFSISGSEFVEMFVGVGASRVRDLFKKAKETSPCLIFIDEIDAVGRQRGVGIGGGNDEREQTLNQLLTEMDGFEGNTGIIVIAATNRPDVLDAALLRPGRFDRQITVDLPSYSGRLGILQVHGRNKRLADSVSLEAIAQRTPGFSGADLANLLNEAAILAARRRKESITELELGDAIDRITIGLTLAPLLDGRKKRLIAYHEVGHALMMTLLKHSDPLEKVTILPRSGGIGGFSKPIPQDEDGLVTRAYMLDLVTIYLGGRAAEIEVFGPDEVTLGASQDIRTVAALARQMVVNFGMTDLGFLGVEETDEGMWPKNRPEYSEELAVQIDRQIRQIVQDCYAQARQLVRDCRPLVDRLVDLLLENETLDGDTFRQIVTDYQQQAALVSTPV